MEHIQNAHCTDILVKTYYFTEVCIKVMTHGQSICARQVFEQVSLINVLTSYCSDIARQHMNVLPENLSTFIASVTNSSAVPFNNKIG